MRRTCPQHHEWEVEGDTSQDGATCPTCAAQAVTSAGGDLLPPPPTPTASTSSAGAYDPELPVLDGYDILGVLGRGGMGVVYRGWQRDLKRAVAVKMISGDAGPELLARFFTEAESVARIKHANIVQIHEVGQRRNKPFFSMELVEGGTLATKLGGTPQAAKEAARIVETLARAMHEVHQQGIIHRDLKPGNVLLEKDGTPKITDFGLAKKLDDHMPGLTATAAILGTVEYMAPEQASKGLGPVGPASDVYGLGAILYEMLTGRPPFRGATLADTLQQVMNEEPVSPSRLQRQIPHDLVAICQHCLEKDPKQRYASALELAADLRRFLDGQQTLVRPLSRIERVRRWCRRNPVLALWMTAAVICLLAGTAFSIFFAIREGHRADEASKNAAEADRQRKQAKREAALSALERGRILFEQNDGGKGLLWIARGLELAREADDDDLVQLMLANLRWSAPWLHRLRCICEHDGSAHGEGDVRSLQFRSDNAVLLSGSHDGTARLWDTQTGAEVARFSRADPRLSIKQARFAPDEKSVFTSDDNAFHIWDTGDHKLRTSVKMKRHDTGGNIMPSPDGRLVATAWTSKRAVIHSLSPEPRLLHDLKHNDEVWGLAFHPTRNVLATGGYENILRLWDLDLETPKPVLEIPHDNNIWAICFDSAGERIYATGGKWSVLVSDVAAGKVIDALPHPGSVLALDLSKDDRFLITGCRDHHARLWHMLKSKIAKQIPEKKLWGQPLPHREILWGVAISPDTRTLASTAQDRAIKIWDRAPALELGACQHAGWVNSIAFRPDSKTLLTTSWDYTARLWSTAEAKPVDEPIKHPFYVSAAAFAPRGDRFATGTLNGQVRLWQADGKPTSVLLKHTKPDRVFALAFAPAENLLASACWDGQCLVWNLDTEAPHIPPLDHKGWVQSVAFSPDGNTLATASADHTAKIWETATGKLLCTLEHPAEVSHALFFPDGKRILTLAKDNAVRFWDAADGKQLGKPLPFGDAVLCVALSPDAKQLLTGHANGASQLWDLATRLPIGPPLYSRSQVRAVAFSPDGKLLATSGEDHVARLWTVPPPLDITVDQAKLWAEVTTGLEIDADGVTRVLEPHPWRERKARLGR